MKRLLLGSLLGSLGGCSCGTYTIAGTDMLYGGLAMDRDDYFEDCSADYGTFGSFDLMGDGSAFVTFFPSHADEDMDWASTAIDLTVYFANADLVEGRTIDVTTGAASLGDASGTSGGVVGLSSGTIEVVGVGEPDEPCTPFRSQVFRLAWDLVWGTDGGPRYTAVGEDDVSLFLEESSSDTGCL